MSTPAIPGPPDDVGVAGQAVRVRSTRATGGSVALDDAVLAGLAPDGGLYLPTRIPPLPDDWREAGSLAGVARRVLAPWWGPDEAEIAALLDEALDFDTPLRPLGGDRWLLELFHGPTLSFKDVGARAMARLAGRALQRRGGEALVLVATSGDTGSAVADGFSGVPGVRVALLYPRGMVSEVQERQLVIERPNVRAFAVDGDFDACQRLVKNAFGDPALADLGLTSANSINVGRLLPQMVYYLWGALQMGRELGEDAAPYVVVPSGNLGNLTAGLLAAASGLPVTGFLAAHNANAFFPSVLEGRRSDDDAPATIATLSNAMDVGSPSNFERLRAWFGASLGDRVDASTVSDEATLARMRATADEDGAIVCPHTAVALEALSRRRAGPGASGDGPAMVLSTAHPAKFPDAVRRATGREPPTAAALEALADAPVRVEPLVAEPAALRKALLSRGWAS